MFQFNNTLFINSTYKMGKKILIILISILFIVSCTSKDYNIRGEVDSKGLNGITVFIKEKVNREWISIDSTVIADKSFVFKGVSDTAKIADIMYEFPEKNFVRQAFVLENGKISVRIDSIGFMYISGTKQNDLLQKYQNEKKEIYALQEKNYIAQKDTTISAEKLKTLIKNMFILEQKEIQLDIKYSTKHINTLVGTHIFIKSFYGMSISQKDSILSLMDAETRNVKRINEIINDLTIEKKVAVGQQFTDFNLPDTETGFISLSEMLGKSDYVLIDFWASWCSPCIRSLPSLKETYNKYKRDKFQILGVSLDEDKVAWKEAIKNHQLTWHHVSDLNGWKCQGARIYAVNSIPCTVLINNKGEIIGRNLTLFEIENILNNNDRSKP